MSLNLRNDSTINDSAMNDSTPNDSSHKRDDAALRELRRKQAFGLLWLALGVFAFSAIRAGRHLIFLPRWWHIW